MVLQPEGTSSISCPCPSYSLSLFYTMHKSSVIRQLHMHADGILATTTDTPWWKSNLYILHFLLLFV